MSGFFKRIRDKPHLEKIREIVFGFLETQKFSNISAKVFTQSYSVVADLKIFRYKTTTEQNSE